MSYVQPAFNSQLSTPFQIPETLATYGSDTVYALLTLRFLEDGKVELNASIVEYDTFSGRYETDDLGSEVAEADDEAIIAADDLGHLAAQALDERRVFDRHGEDFGRAVEDWLDARERAAQYAHSIAAE